MVGDCAGIALIGGSGQNQLAASIALALQPVEQCFVEEQALGSWHHPFGDFSLQVGFASAQPDGQHEEIEHIDVQQF